MNNKIYLLIDYRDQFYFSTRYRGACIDINKLKANFKKAGFDLIIKNFHEINFRTENYTNEWVLYQSSEDTNLLYKSYIEDIVLALELQGAKLIPNFPYFRAHHNKVFMEILRDSMNIDEIKNIQSRGFGTFEEYSKSDLFKSNKLTIIKPGSGTRSSNIELLNTQSKKRKYAHKISRSFTFENFKLWVSKIKTGRRYTPMSNNRCKFIIQNFIPDLKGDYRILAYGDKYYCVYRENRKDDFRASGSGKLNFEITPPKGLLDYSKKIYEKFNTPFMSLDIGYRDGKFYLFEFQCLCLGQYTLEKSSFHYKQNNSSWKRVYEKPDLEREVTKTIIDFIKK